MEQKYTVLEIAKEALNRYRIEETETMLDTVVKKIRKIINVQQFEATGMKKSTPQTKKSGKAYSKEIKNEIVQNLLFDYMIERTYDEGIKRMKSPNYYNKQAEDSNGVWEDETLTFLNMTHQERDVLLENQGNTEEISDNYVFIREKKMEIMLEALFSKYYSLNIDELVNDVNRVTHAKYYKQGNFNKDDMRSMDHLNHWQNYVSENEE